MRKFALAGLAGTMLMMVTPAHSAAYFIAGQWYYFSLNFVADVAKISGKDLKIGTFVAADIKIDDSQSECANPQSHAVVPGKGPKGTNIHTNSPDLTPQNFVKKDRVHGNIYQTTATAADLVSEDRRLTPPDGLCKVSGGTQWLPVFWQDRLCDKQEQPGEVLQDPICYNYLAAYVNGVLTYITGPNKDQWVGVNTSEQSWTFVFLPTVFRFSAYLDSDSSDGYANIYGRCTFPPNNEPGARHPGDPYSLDNPPVNGWAALIQTSPTTYTHLFYQCVEIPAADFAAP